MDLNYSLVSAEVIAALAGFFLALVFPDKWGITVPWVVFMVEFITHVLLFPEIDNATPELLTGTFLVSWMVTSCMRYTIWSIEQKRRSERGQARLP